MWAHIKRENIPPVSLCFTKPYGMFEERDFNGASMRFRSIGERGIIWSMGADENEPSFERLRETGYM